MTPVEDRIFFFGSPDLSGQIPMGRIIGVGIGVGIGDVPGYSRNSSHVTLSHCLQPREARQQVQTAQTTQTRRQPPLTHSVSHNRLHASRSVLTSCPQHTHRTSIQKRASLSASPNAHPLAMARVMTAPSPTLPSKRNGPSIPKPKPQPRPEQKAAPAQKSSAPVPAPASGAGQSAAQPTNRARLSLTTGYVLLVLSSLLCSSTLYTLASPYIAQELAAVSRRLDSDYEVLALVGWRMIELAAGWWGRFDGKLPRGRSVTMRRDGLTD